MTVTIDGTAGITTAGGITYPTAQTYSGNIAAATAVATTSGTSIDFTGIPSWVRRITVMLNAVSTNGTSNLQLQIGSGAISTSGYNSTAVSGAGAINATSGFLLTYSITAASTQSGFAMLVTLGSNIWVEQSNLAFNNASVGNTSAGNFSLSGTLDRVRLTTINGTDAFDAGSVNILYE